MVVQWSARQLLAVVDEALRPIVAVEHISLEKRTAAKIGVQRVIVVKKRARLSPCVKGLGQMLIGRGYKTQATPLPRYLGWQVYWSR